MINTIWTKMKESFYAAFTAAVLILVIVLLVWVPLKVIPRIFSTGSNYVATTLTSTFMPSEATSTVTKANGTTNVYNTYNYGYATTTTSGNKSVVNTVAINGKPDLTIKLIAVGSIDRYTRQFSQTQYTNTGDEIGIRFEIVNVGNSASGIWSFKATLPSLTTPNYQSDNQVSLNPGDKIQYVLGFDNPNYSGTNSAYIAIDTLRFANDSDTSNNYLTVPLTLNGSSNGVINFNNTNSIFTNQNTNTVYPYNYTNTNTSYPYNYNYSNYGVINGNGYPYNYYGQSYNYNNYIGTTYTWTSLSGSCSVIPSTAYVGQAVTWNAAGNGGNGYYTYAWNGTDNLLSTSKNPVITYYTSGLKTANVTITSNGANVSKQCTVNVIDNTNNNVIVGGDRDIHGCIGSAGYSWCDVKNKCLRTWEESCTYVPPVSTTDLSVNLVGVGVIDSSGQFISSSQVSRGGTAAIKVRITNIGSVYSGTWSITGTMTPSLTGYTYRQDNQMSLAPGATSEYTIVFGNPQVAGTNTFSVQITPSTADTNTYNNSLTASIMVY